jgi:NRPS condensation-like uncharacterized protein
LASLYIFSQSLDKEGSEKLDFPTGLTTKELKRRGRSIPLNCVDKCLLALDSINEPMLIHAILNIEGEIDHVRLNQAILSAQKAYPIMRTILRSKGFRAFREIQEDVGEGVLTVKDMIELQDANYDGYLSEWINQPMDIRKAFPVRVLLVKKNEVESSLVFTFHHSATDGLRAVIFVRKVIESYGNEVSEDSEPSEDIRISRKGDELLEFARSQRSRVEHYHMKMISSLFHRFVIAAFPPPTRVFHDKSGHSKELCLCFTTVRQRELEQIESKSRSAGVELNDILLAACYGVVEKWNSIHGKASKKIRIMAPVNISPKGFRYVVSNQASWISPSTSPEERAAPAKLLRKVRADTIYATQNRTAFSLVYFFYVCSRFPLVVMRGMCMFLMITRTYVDTILITNIGLIWPKIGSEEPAVTSIGSSNIVNVTGSAPVVTPMGLSISACIYNKNLALSLTYRPALFSEEKAKMFLDLYVEEIINYQVNPGGS